MRRYTQSLPNLPGERETGWKRRSWIARRRDLADAVGALVARGATRIVVIPYFLTLGIHLQRDLPRIADELRRIYPGVSIDIAEPLDGHPALLEILIDRWKEKR